MTRDHIDSRSKDTGLHGYQQALLCKGLWSSLRVLYPARTRDTQETLWAIAGRRKSKAAFHRIMYSDQEKSTASKIGDQWDPEH